MKLMATKAVFSKIDPDYANTFIHNYHRERYKYEELKELLCAEIRHIASHARVPVAQIEGRTKEPDTVFEKIKRKNYNDPAKQLTDLCGARVVTTYESHVDKMTQLITKHLKPIAILLPDHCEKKRSPRADQFGYESNHLVFQIRKCRIPWRRYAAFRAEIQIRSTLRHAWAMVSHELVYKQMAFPEDEILGKMGTAMGAIHTTDEAFDTVKTSLAQAHKRYELHIRAKRLHKVPLSALSLSLYFSIRQPKFIKILNRLKKVGVNCGMRHLELPEFNRISIGRLAYSLKARGLKNLNEAQQSIDGICQNNVHTERQLRRFMKEVNSEGGIFSSDGIDIITVLISMDSGIKYGMKKFPPGFDWSGEHLSKPTQQVLNATREVCRGNLKPS